MPRVEDDVTDIQVAVPTLAGRASPPVTEIKVVYAATREADGVRPKKRVDEPASGQATKKVKSASPESAGATTTTVMRVLQTTSHVQEPVTATVISTSASAVTLPSASVVPPTVASPSEMPAGPSPEFGSEPRAAAFAEIVCHSPPREDISDDKV